MQAVERCINEAEAAGQMAAAAKDDDADTCATARWNLAYVMEP